MSQQLVITSVVNLESITHVIHDRWFEVNDVAYDASRSRLTVPLESDSPAWWRPTSGGSGEKLRVGTLCIANVDRYVLRETEGIGRYDFNSVRFNADEGRLDLITNIPVSFSVWVKSLLVTVSMD